MRMKVLGVFLHQGGLILLESILIIRKGMYYLREFSRECIFWQEGIVVRRLESLD